MSAWSMCCYYCGFTAMVGIYFHLILSAMEYRQNQSLKYKWNINKPQLNDIYTTKEWDLHPSGTDANYKLYPDDA